VTNQYSKDKRGFGEYCPRPQFRMTEEQYKKFLSDVKESKLEKSQYVRCKLGLEPWPEPITPPEAVSEEAKASEGRLVAPLRLRPS
jgi:hypothetical protein